VDVSTGARVLGRFGWKAEQPTVRQQVAAAFNGDLGITSSLFSEQDCPPEDQRCRDATDGGRPEIDDALLTDVERYSQLLAVPARRAFGEPTMAEGARSFQDIGCADCHVPHHLTGEHPDLPELSGQDIWPYTDLLLHDMGDDLADGDLQMDREWRTPPLWGIGLIPEVNDHQRLLHDGRANGVVEAILWHGGEALGAREAFQGLSEKERDALVRFIDSL
jgi:CxxC motif-containing protein (DUF1111 family)